MESGRGEVAEDIELVWPRGKNDSVESGRGEVAEEVSLSLRGDSGGVGGNVSRKGEP